MHRKPEALTALLPNSIEPPDLELLRGIILDDRPPTDEELAWMRKHLGLAAALISARSNETKSSQITPSAIVETDSASTPLAKRSGAVSQG